MFCCTQRGSGESSATRNIARSAVRGEVCNRKERKSACTVRGICHGAVDCVGDLWKENGRLAGVHGSLDGLGVIGHAIADGAKLVDIRPVRQVGLVQDPRRILDRQAQRTRRSARLRRQRRTRHVLIHLAWLDDRLAILYHRRPVSCSGDVARKEMTVSEFDRR